MKNTIDKDIQILFDVIEKKKAKLEKIKNPSFETNCSLQLYSDRPINLRTQTIGSLVSLHSQIMIASESFVKSAKTLNVDVNFNQQGFTAEQWVKDIALLINTKNTTAQRKELEQDERELHELISPEELRRLKVAAKMKKLKDE